MGDQKKSSWVAVVKRSNAEISRQASQRNNVVAHSAPDNRSEPPSSAVGPGPSILNNDIPTVSAFNRDERPRNSSRNFSRNYRNTSPAPNQERENDIRSGPPQQAPIGHPLMQNHGQHGNSTQRDGLLGNAPMNIGHWRPEGRGSQPRTRNSPASHAGSGLTPGHSTSSCHSNTPQSLPQAVSQPRRCRSRDGNAASLLNTTPSNHGMRYSPRNLSLSEYSAQKRESLPSYPTSIPSYQSFQQPTPSYYITYNIALQTPCRYLTIHQQLPNQTLALYPSATAQPSVSPYSQHWEYEHIATPVLDLRNPSHFQYEVSRDVHYQNPWGWQLNPATEHRPNESTNTYLVYSPPRYSVPATIGANSSVGSATPSEPLYHSSVWGLPLVSDNSQFGRNLFPQYTGGINNSSSTYGAHNFGEYSSNSFPNGPSSVTQEGPGIELDHSAQQDLEAEMRLSVDGESSNANATEKDKEGLKKKEVGEKRSP